MRTVITVSGDRTLVVNLGNKNNGTKIRLIIETFGYIRAIFEIDCIRKRRVRSYALSVIYLNIHRKWNLKPS